MVLSERAENAEPFQEAERVIFEKEGIRIALDPPEESNVDTHWKVTVWNDSPYSIKADIVPVSINGSAETGGIFRYFSDAAAGPGQYGVGYLSCGLPLEEIQEFSFRIQIKDIFEEGILFADEEDVVISTLAHEFQHLICFTGYFSGGNKCDTWFNEAMSGYIEEALYQGSKESDFACFHDSERIRYGQSLYNFGTDSTGFSFDIGVYGSVYLFSEYLKNIAGEDIFSDFHNKWKNTYTTMNTYEGIYRVVPEETIQKIDELVEYPSYFRFSSEEEQWISKLTLSFYLSTFTMDDNTPEQYRQILLPYLLYDRITDAQIEGGGRVMLAVNDGSFQIPEDADKGLVYVGLNSDLEVVTDFVCR